MKRLNFDGFGGMEALLLLAIVLLIGGAGSYVYSKNHHGALPFVGNKATPVTYTGSSGSTSPNGIPGGATGAGQATTNPSASTSVIKVTDGGFQISVPASLKDLTYQVSQNGTTKTVTFSTSSLTAAIPGCAATSGSGAFETIIRGTGTYQPPANSADGALIKQYSGYYLAYLLPAAPCAKNLTTDQQSMLDNLQQAFYSSLNTVTGL